MKRNFSALQDVTGERDLDEKSDAAFFLLLERALLSVLHQQELLDHQQLQEVERNLSGGKSL